MKHTILFIVSFVFLSACSGSNEPPPVPGFVQEWATVCIREPEECRGDIAYVQNGDIFIVSEKNGQLEPDGTWPDLSGYTDDGRKLSVFLLGLENADQLGVIEHVVRADVALTDPQTYARAVADLRIAMETKEE